MKSFFSKLIRMDSEERNFLSNALNRERLINFSNQLKVSHDVKILKDYSVKQIEENDQRLDMKIVSTNMS